MIAFVTGANGFIGSHLVESLLQRGFHVRAFVRKTSNLHWLEGLGVERVVGDGRHLDFPQEALEGADYVFHVAGAVQAISRKDYFEANVEGTRRLLEAVARGKPPLKKFVLVSSQAAGGPSHSGRGVSEEDLPCPVSFYGESKLVAEKVALNFAKTLPLVILRPPTIYGPRETRVLAAFQMVSRGFALTIGFRPKLISFCYVGDLVEALLQAASRSQESGRIYNVAGPRPCEWLEFLGAIGRALGRRYIVFRLPKSAAFLLGASGEVYSRVSRRLTLFSWQRVKDFAQNEWVLDGTRIRQELGWRERETLDQGIARTAEWYRRIGWI